MDAHDSAAPIPTAQLAALGIPATKAQPLDLLFCSKAARTQSGAVRAHITEQPLPAGAILQLCPGVGIVSPELCFLQLAHEMPVARLALCGMELCGTYALCGAEMKLRTRRALTNAASLRAAAQTAGLGAKSKVTAALNYVLDGAASPMEAKLALLLTFPTTRGGFGLPLPALNAPIALGAAAREMYPHATCRADLFWRTAQVDVEYDGEEAHTGEMHTKDVARAGALACEGVSVVTLAAAQVYDKEAFARAAALIAKKLGHPLRIRVKGFAEKQDNLRQELGF